MITSLRSAKMTWDQAQEVIQALQARGVTLPCPRCGNGHFTLLEGFFNQPISGDLTGASGTMGFSAGPTVPSIVTACTECGILSQHAVGVLRLAELNDNSPFAF